MNCPISHSRLRWPMELAVLAIAAGCANHRSLLHFILCKLHVILLLILFLFVNSLYHPAPLSTDYLGNLSFTLQLEMCPVGRVEVLKKYKTDG